MALRMTTQMANANGKPMALACVRDMAHSTPLHSTTGVEVVCGVCGYDQIQSHRYLPGRPDLDLEAGRTSDAVATPLRDALRTEGVGA